MKLMRVKIADRKTATCAMRKRVDMNEPAQHLFDPEDIVGELKKT